MNQRRLLYLLSLVAAMALVVSDASAQFGGMGGSRAGRAGRGADGNAGRRGDPQVIREPNNYEMIEYRLGSFQDDLKLAPEQLGAWQAFAANVRAYAGDIAREESARRNGPTSLSAAEVNGLRHIAQAVDAARNRLAALEEVETSARILYKALTPQQQGLADLRMPSVVAPRPTTRSTGGGRDNLPDFGAPPRPQQ